jgi:ADP-ribose pyrophosphatase YjhB (NUDIX family)
MIKVFAARAVIIDQSNNTAILSVKNGEYFKIPGGTLDDQEDIKDGLKREILEEAGCDIEVLDKIGEHEFYVSEKDKTYRSTCFLAKLKGNRGEPQFDDWEKSRDFMLLWINIDKAIKVFENIHPTDPYEKIIHHRDLNFLKKARKIIKKDNFIDLK